MKLPNIPPSLMTKKKIISFKDYLREHGCEIQANSNEYELVRFKSALGIGVLYTGKNGLSTNVPFVADAISSFFLSVTWHAGKFYPKGRTPSGKRKSALRRRDGAMCFYCTQPLNDDVTEEHLAPHSHGGSNHLDNIVLAHFACNQRANSKSLVEKILLRDQFRRGDFVPDGEGI